MTAPTSVPDATRCPDCAAPLAGTDSCPACGLQLTGPQAARLWEVDVELLALEHSRRVLMHERAALLHALGRRAHETELRTPPLPRQEWTPQRVQNLLLALGGLLLAGAALVFAVVTYERLGATGRALVLATLTVVAAVAAPRLRRRGLVSTAETVGAVVLALAALDAYGLRTLGLAADSAPALYAAGAAAVLAAAAGAYGTLAGLRLVKVAAVLLAQLPVLLLLDHVDASDAATGLALAALAAADLAVFVLADRLDAEPRRVLQACAVVIGGAALATSLLASTTQEQPALSAAALVACAALLTAGSRSAEVPTRSLLTAGAVAALGAAVFALVRDDLATAAAALAVLGLVVAAAASRLPSTERTGPVGGALLVAGSAVLVLAEPVVEGVVLPVTWFMEPWSLTPGSSAREAVTTGVVWSGPAITPFVVLTAALTAGLAGHLLARPRLAAAPVAALGLAAAVLLPLGLDLPWGVGLAVLLVLAAALAAGGAALLGRVEAVPLGAAGVALALHAAAWSLASQTATLLVLPLVALGCAALAVPRQPAPAVPVAVAGLLGTAHVGAVGVAVGLAADQVGGLLLVAVRSRSAEAVTLAGGLAALALASTDVGWLSWVLAGLGLLALATALRPDRRPVAVAGGLLLSASSWVRLADAGITAPEPYVLPLAAVALVLGGLRRRAEPSTRSWAAYGPGLVLALVPSLLAGLDDDALTRPLLVGLAALAVLLLGARTRLQAPLAVGAGVLVVDALDLVGPYAEALPRWLSLGTAGALLLVVGATYEQRRRDLARLREGFSALA